MRQIKILLSLLVAACLFLTACGGPTEASGDGLTPEDSAVPTLAEAEPEEEPAPYSCPFDNAPLIEMPLRPLLISIDNNPKARPQTGLNQADIVYEVPAEGGISRYLALYYHGTAEKIGPVRSARPYMIDIAREWDAVFLHAGGSPAAYAYLSRGIVDSFNEISHSAGFWRDKSQKAPHNLYTSIEGIWPYIEEKGWDESISVRSYLFSDEPVTGADASWVKTAFPYSKISYRYDSESGLYQRRINGEDYTDAVTGEVLTTSNIIVQRVKSKVLDSEGRLEINLVGSGEAWLIRDGVAIAGTWKKEGLDKPTVFYDENDREFQLKTGRTWIEVMDQNCTFQLPTGENQE